MRATCSRCNKKAEIVFEHEIVSMRQLREYRFCPRCLRWALTYLLAQDPQNSEKLFLQVDAISALLKDNADKQRKAKSVGSLKPSGSVPDNF